MNNVWNDTLAAAEHGIVCQTFVEVRSRLLCISEEVLLGWTWLERFTTIEVLLILFFYALTLGEFFY